MLKQENAVTKTVAKRFICVKCHFSASASKVPLLLNRGTQSTQKYVVGCSHIFGLIMSMLNQSEESKPLSVVLQTAGLFFTVPPIKEQAGRHSGVVRRCSYLMHGGPGSICVARGIHSQTFSSLAFGVEEREPLTSLDWTPVVSKFRGSRNVNAGF